MSPPTPTGIRIAYQGGSADQESEFPGSYDPLLMPGIVVAIEQVRLDFVPVPVPVASDLLDRLVIGG